MLASQASTPQVGAGDQARGGHEQPCVVALDGRRHGQQCEAEREEGQQASVSVPSPPEDGCPRADEQGHADEGVLDLLLPESSEEREHADDQGKRQAVRGAQKTDRGTGAVEPRSVANEGTKGDRHGPRTYPVLQCDCKTEDVGLRRS
jgi:hypothetical protein